MDSISSIRPASGATPAGPVRPNPENTPRSQQVAPERSPSHSDSDPGPARAVEPVELGAAAERLNDYVRSSSKLRFRVGDGDLTVQVVDASTDEVIRSIPAEKVLAIRDHFRELTGLLLDDSA